MEVLKPIPQLWIEYDPLNTSSSDEENTNELEWLHKYFPGASGQLETGLNSLFFEAEQRGLVDVVVRLVKIHMLHEESQPLTPFEWNQVTRNAIRVDRIYDTPLLLAFLNDVTPASE